MHLSKDHSDEFELKFPKLSQAELSQAELSQAELSQAEPSQAEKVPSQVKPSWGILILSWNRAENMHLYQLAASFRP